ncbi:hypothetical protein [Psychromonas sp. 14N.309.X.WAT.B.A12]|uniref:hypothetical protein n=1 Tax=unclassified Psychromonas TaxID=2614957 RepID=UPI0025B04AC8|nr:hypothetical protein [Psychromonas sp. 14N.309.X.WAT.B.A12]MDN2664551.1 hypothetical protein [Psychromonas sp. 14N.309.X.WAT.B.A12]
MVNVNVQLPPVIATPFPQAAEGLHRENLLQTAIPKTEQAHAYAKIRGEQEREETAYQSREIIQDNKQGSSRQQEQSTHSQQRRNFFFAAKLKLSPHELEALDIELKGISDFNEVISVIQAKYKNAVSPYPQPSVSYNV